MPPSTGTPSASASELPPPAVSFSIPASAATPEDESQSEYYEDDLHQLVRSGLMDDNTEISGLSQSDFRYTMTATTTTATHHHVRRRRRSSPRNLVVVEDKEDNDDDDEGPSINNNRDTSNSRRRRRRRDAKSTSLTNNDNNNNNSNNKVLQQQDTNFLVGGWLNLLSIGILKFIGLVVHWYLCITFTLVNRLLSIDTAAAARCPPTDAEAAAPEQDDTPKAQQKPEAGVVLLQEEEEEEADDDDDDDDELDGKLSTLETLTTAATTTLYNKAGSATVVMEQHHQQHHPKIRHRDSDNSKRSTSEDYIDNEFCSEKRLLLLDTIARVQRQYLQSEGPRVVFGCLLTALLDLMDSEYGFIGECKWEDDGTMYLQTHAITNIAWNVVTRDFYEDNKESGLKFYNMNSLFGKVMTTQAPVISNTPATDKRGCGVPEGHPPLNYFLGIPFFRKGGVMNGMVGIANKPGGFSTKDIEFLEPFTVTCGNLIHAYWQNQRNKELIEGLESKVKERTAALETLNRDLEAANTRVVQASQAQLQHFACMSHEIRTPLNCIVGLSSLLLSQQQDAIEKEKQQEQEGQIVAVKQQHNPTTTTTKANDNTVDETGFQKLTPYQEESIRMIVTSGDLLLTVVNDVLDYSKLESGNVDIEIQPTSLQQVLNAVVHSIQMKLRDKEQEAAASAGHNNKKKNNAEGGAAAVTTTMSAPSTTTEGGGVRISTDFDMNLPDTVRIDGRRLQQILYNLLGNAVKFSPNGGTVELKVQLVDVENEDEETDASPKEIPDAAVSTDEAEPTKEAEATTSTSDAGGGAGSSKCPFTKQSNNEAPVASSGCPFTRSTPTTQAAAEKSCPFKAINENEKSGKKMIRFIVKDYGKGIEKENFDRIFKPFLQANAQTERLYGGTGLGLAITSKLAKALGGGIRVDSEVGKWSEFTVDIPFLEVPVDAQQESHKLRETLVMMIDDPNESLQDDNKRLKSILDHYKIAFRSFAEVGAFVQAASTMDSGKVQCICFVPEDVFATSVLAEFCQSKPNCVSLISFGPNFKTNGKSKHVRSIRQMLPSVLVDTLVKETGANLRRCSRMRSSSMLTAESNDQLSEQSNPQDDSYRFMKVLIAEDNKINQKVLLRMLKRLGVENVKIADNGRIACDMEAEEAFDICLMDMQMPLMDGLEACREILGRPQRMEEQGQQATHGVPAIVFLTAQVSSSFVAECEAAGSSHFLAKPCNVHDIEACLRQTWADRSGV